MPTQSTTYNSRVTDESLEKRFRDTFKSQGGAELVDDLYAQGVIVPIVDFTAAATGQQLAENLQTAWDFSTGHTETINTTNTIISTAGFWQVDLTCSIDSLESSNEGADIKLTDGLSVRTIWQLSSAGGSGNFFNSVTDGRFVVFLRSGDSLTATSDITNCVLNTWYRQIATTSGDLVNPTGFTSS